MGKINPFNAVASLVFPPAAPFLLGSKNLTTLPGGGDISASQGLAADQANLARLQASMSRGLFEQTGPLRETGVGQLGDFLKTGALPMSLNPELAGGIGLQEQELQAARQGILNELPRGGVQQQALAELPLRRLMGREALQQGLRTNLFQTAVGTGFGSVPTAISGVGAGATGVGAAGGLSQNLGLGLRGQGIQQQQILGQGIGSILGLGLKGLMGKPA